VGLRDGRQLVKKISVHLRQAALDPRRVRRRRPAFRGRLRSCPQKTFPQFAMCATSSDHRGAAGPAYGVALALNERGVNEALASGVGGSRRRGLGHRGA